MNRQQAINHLRALGPTGQQALFTVMAENEKAITYNANYSEVVFPMAVAGGVGTIAAGVRRAFGYKQGDDLTAAGYPAGAGLADPRHTNLLAPGQTRNNEQVAIFGIAVGIQPSSDDGLVKEAIDKFTVRLQIGGNQGYELGPVLLVPGAMGLSGSGRTRIYLPPDEVTNFTDVAGSLANGLPVVGNYKPFKKPFIWNPAGAADANLAVEIQLHTPHVVTLPAARVVGADVGAYDVPATNTLFIKFMVQLIGLQAQRRSMNS